MQKLKTIFFISIILIQYSFSQSEFLRRGQSGVGAGGGFGVNREATTINYFAGFSFKGILNADLMYSKANGGKVKDAVLTPTITYYLIKQEDAKRAPILGISLGYCQYTSKTTEVVSVPGPDFQGIDTTLNTERKINAVKIGISAFHRIGNWKTLMIQPLISGGALIHRYGADYVLRGGVSVGSRIKKGPLLLVTPAFEIQSGLTTFVCSFSIVY